MSLTNRAVRWCFVKVHGRWQVKFWQNLVSHVCGCRVRWKETLEPMWAKVRWLG